VLLAASTGVIVQTPSLAATTTSATTAFVWDGSEGGNPGHGIDDTFRAGESGITITVSGTSSGVIAHLDSTDVRRRIRYAELRLFPARGGHLTPGTYNDAVEAFHGPEPTAGMWIASDNSACAMSGGSYVIHEATYDPQTDAVRSFAATFQVGCSDKLIFGEIRYKSSVAWVSRHGVGVVAPFMTPNVGEAVERTVTVTSDGSSALRTGPVRIEATRWPFNDGAEPGIDLDVGHFGCNTATGSFTVFDIAFDTSGQMSRLAAAWLFGCTPLDRLEAGEIRWHSDVPMASRSVDRENTGMYYAVSARFESVTSQSVQITSDGSGPLAIGPVEVDGEDADSFSITRDTCSGAKLPRGDSCTVTVDYLPRSAGAHGAVLLIPDNTTLGRMILDLGGTAEESPADGSPAGQPNGGGNGGQPAADAIGGYWMVGADGTVFGFGDAKRLGNAAVGASTAVDLEPTRTGKGYWIVDDLGHVFAFGDATHRGNVDRPKLAPGEKVTSLSATADGGGYWIFTDRGRVLTFGNAPFLGDVANVRLNGPVLDSIVTPSGKGYYMVASDGGIFAFGDATFYGSMGGEKLNAPVQSLVPDSDGIGYWLVASDGGIFAFQAGFKGSMGGTKLNKPVTGMVRAGRGYLMVGEDGGIFDFSGDPNSFKGSLGANPPGKPITSVAVLEDK
jgi:hypothetical protein